ncbi:MAG: SWIM zinc finger family protein [Bacteroidota bacterium]
MNWTEDQVLQLSPDASSTKAGLTQAKKEKWLILHKNDKAIWGEIKGSGKTPYQTVIDINNVAFKCTCPSRKFPCKHALGLFLVYARSPEAFTDKEPPEWANKWLTSREQREEKKKAKSEKPVDEKAQAKRVAAREQKVAEGIEEVTLWVKDLIRNGLVNIPERAYEFWQSTAARMVDAQASGMAAMVRNLGKIDYTGEAWQEELLRQLVRIYMTAEGYKRLDSLPDNLQEDVKSLIGWTYNQEEIKAQDGIRDTWQVLGRTDEQEERLTTVKVWLYGQQTQRFALLLHFFAPGQPRQVTLVPGMVMDASLAFYPGSVPLRALIKEEFGTEAFESLSGLQDFNALEHECARIVAQNPWMDEIPLVVESVIPVMEDKQIDLVDRENRKAAVSSTFDKSWLLMALSGGKPLTIFMIRKGSALLPLGAWSDAGYHLF